MNLNYHKINNRHHNQYMSIRSFSFSNKKQREYQKVMSETEWIIKTSNSYHEAYSKLKKVKMYGTPLLDSTVITILTAKESLNLNPKLKKRSKSSKTCKKRLKKK